MSAEDLSELESTIAITVTPPDAAGKCDVVAKTKVKNEEGNMKASVCIADWFLSAIMFLL